MLAYLSDTSDENNVNPAYWGPFSVIGEGRRSEGYLLSAMDHES
jgi:hypothetical protein